MFEHKRSLGLMLDYLETEGHLDGKRRVAAERQLARGGGAPGHGALAALQAAGAWIAVLFLLAFVLLAFRAGNDEYLLVGLALLGGGLVMSHAGVPFARQFARALLLLGQLLTMIGSTRGLGFERGFVPASIACCAAMHALHADGVSRFLSTAVTIMFTASWLCIDWPTQAWLLPAGLGLALVGYHTSEAPEALRPAVYAAACSLTALLALGQWYLPGDLLVRLALAAAVVGAIAAVRRGLPPPAPRRVAAGAAALAVVALFGTPGLLAAALLLVLGHDRQDRVLIGLGGLSFPYFLASFYHDLHLTLAAKSAALVAGGLLLLIARRYVREGGSR